jgi:hypothetical protein
MAQVQLLVVVQPSVAKKGMALPNFVKKKKRKEKKGGHVSCPFYPSVQILSRFFFNFWKIFLKNPHQTKDCFLLGWTLL